MTRARRTVRKWGYIAFCTFCTTGIVVEAIFLAPVVKRQARYAEDGRMARERQQLVRPVSLKVYEDARRRGVITSDDLACFKGFAGSCPKPAP